MTFSTVVPLHSSSCPSIAPRRASPEAAEGLASFRDRRDPAWYDPSYRMPGAPVLPAVGAAASFGLVVFMQPASIAIGVAVMLGAYLWFRYYAGSVELKGDI
jgi:hypothetical protein